MTVTTLPPPRLPQTQKPWSDDGLRDAVTAYAQQVKRIPLLSLEEELALVERIAASRAAAAQLQQEPELDAATRRALVARRDDAEAAHRRLVLSHLPLVIAIAKQFRPAGTGMTLADLIQEGNIGLIKAAWKYTPIRGRFAATAAYWIKGHIYRALETSSHLIRRPEHISERLRQIRAARAQLELRLGREPTTEEIGAATGYSARQVRRVLDANTTLLSLDEQREADDESQKLLIDHTLDLEALAQQRAQLAALREALAQLTEREQQILVLRFGLDGSTGRSQQTIGTMLDLSQRYVSSAEAKALGKLREALHPWRTDAPHAA
jgi:RNA polymerase sigma factor (sigma-70 family)